MYYIKEEAWHLEIDGRTEYLPNNTQQKLHTMVFNLLIGPREMWL